jgi:hypothetical protein
MNHDKNLVFLSDIDKKFNELGVEAQYKGFIRCLNNLGGVLLQELV